jgi:hypothetical protein
MAEYAEMVGSRPKVGKRAEPKVEEIHLKKAENGGHIAEHHFEQGPEVNYKKPEPHVFGESEGKQLLSHISEHMGIKSEAPDEELAHPEKD